MDRESDSAEYMKVKKAELLLQNRRTLAADIKSGILNLAAKLDYSHVVSSRAGSGPYQHLWVEGLKKVMMIDTGDRPADRKDQGAGQHSASSAFLHRLQNRSASQGERTVPGRNASPIGRSISTPAGRIASGGTTFGSREINRTKSQDPHRAQSPTRRRESLSPSKGRNSLHSFEDHSPPSSLRGSPTLGSWNQKYLGDLTERISSDTVPRSSSGTPRTQEVLMRGSSVAKLLDRMGSSGSKNPNRTTSVGFSFEDPFTRRVSSGMSRVPSDPMSGGVDSHADGGDVGSLQLSEAEKIEIWTSNDQILELLSDSDANVNKLLASQTFRMLSVRYADEEDDELPPEIVQDSLDTYLEINTAQPEENAEVDEEILENLELQVVEALNHVVHIHQKAIFRLPRPRVHESQLLSDQEKNPVEPLLQEHQESYIEDIENRVLDCESEEVAIEIVLEIHSVRDAEDPECHSVFIDQLDRQMISIRSKFPELPLAPMDLELVKFNPDPTLSSIIWYADVLRSRFSSLLRRIRALQSKASGLVSKSRLPVRQRVRSQVLPVDNVPDQKAIQRAERAAGTLLEFEKVAIENFRTLEMDLQIKTLEHDISELNVGKRDLLDKLLEAYVAANWRKGKQHFTDLHSTIVLYFCLAELREINTAVATEFLQMTAILGYFKTLDQETGVECSTRQLGVLGCLAIFARNDNNRLLMIGQSSCKDGLSQGIEKLAEQLQSILLVQMKGTPVIGIRIFDLISSLAKSPEVANLLSQKGFVDIGLHMLAAKDVSWGLAGKICEFFTHVYFALGTIPGFRSSTTDNDRSTQIIRFALQFLKRLGPKGDGKQVYEFRSQVQLLKALSVRHFTLIVSESGLNEIAKFIRAFTTNSHAQAAGCEILYNCIKDNESASAAVMSLGLPLLLLNSLQHHNTVRNVVKHGLAALNACISRSPECSAVIAAHSGDEVILQLQQYYKLDVVTVDLTSAIMAKLTTHTAQMGPNTLKYLPAFTVSLLAAYQEYPSVVKNCNRILVNLIRDTKVLLTMGKLDAIPVIIHSMGSFLHSRCIQKASCAVLAALSCVPENMEEMQQEGAKEALQHAAERYPADQEIQKFRDLVSILLTPQPEEAVELTG